MLRALCLALLLIPAGGIAVKVNGEVVVLEQREAALCQSEAGCYLVPREVADEFHRKLIELKAVNEAMKEQAERRCGWPT